MLSYELCSIPLSICTLNGEMRKTTRSALLKELELEGTSVNFLPASSITTNTSCLIVDLMALVQTIKKGDLETFGDVAVNLSKAIHGMLIR